MLTKMRAFVLRMKTWGEVDHVGDALAADRITIGWSHVRGLIGLQNLREVREAVRAASGDEDYRRAGHGAGNLWRFLHEMQPDDRVLVPRGDEVYLAKVTGPPGYDESAVTQDIAHFRPVEWLNGKNPFPRHGLPSKLQFRVGPGNRRTCADITGDLSEVLALETGGVRTDTAFEADLHGHLVTTTIETLLKGKMNPKSFEHFLRDLFQHLGATEGTVRGGRGDKGADIVLEMPLGVTPLRQRVAVQAKYYHDGRPVGPDAVRQLVAGMDAEDADLGVIVTTTVFSDEASAEASKSSTRIELIDGAHLASMIVEHGVPLPQRTDEE